MHLSRRDLLKLIAATTSGAALLHGTQRLALALTVQPNPPTVLWFNANGPDLGLLPLLGQQVPQVLPLVTLQWNVQWHDAILPRTRAVDEDVGGTAPIVVLESLPEAVDLQPDSDSPLVRRLGSARAAVLLGTEACFGGFTTDTRAVQAVERLCRALKTPLIRLPGIPAPPHHLVGVLAHLEYFGFPALDAHGRPTLYYGETVCVSCERRADLDAGRFAGHFGEAGCLLKLGCKGIVTHNTCSSARWNNGENWCVGAGGPCTGCSEPGFPDHGGVGLYGALAGGAEGARPLLWGAVEHIGYALLALTGVGLGLQALRRWLAPLDTPRRPTTALAQDPPDSPAPSRAAREAG